MGHHEMRLSEQYETINRFRRIAPVNVEGLAQALGVRVHRAWLDDDISGMIERRRNGSYQIVVNAAHPSTRQRFTIAHELGHYMLHRHLIGDGVDDDRAYRSTQAGKYFNTAIGPKEETEANRFAVSVLMPHDLIERLKEERGHTTPRELARDLEVSEHAMSIRLGVPYDRKMRAAV